MKTDDEESWNDDDYDDWWKMTCSTCGNKRTGPNELWMNHDFCCYECEETGEAA